MNKKVFLTIGVIIVLITAWYLLSPLLRNPQLDEASPLGTATIKDNFERMDEKTKAEFESAMEIAKNIVMEKREAMPSTAKLVAKADFRPRAHEVQGAALLIEQSGQKLLRFENFQTINGPKLHIYLASSLSDEDFVDLGQIRATRGNVNYEIPALVDTNKYDKVLVWCVTFRILFSYAYLEPA